jgi:hypothetical protein
MQLQNIPLDIVSQYQWVANNVYDCAVKTQHNVYILHGPNSEQEHKEQLPHFEEEFTENNFYAPPNKLIHLHTNAIYGSIILSGLSKNTVVICNKINHLLLRQCSEVNVYLKKGTVSGLDILKCHQIFVKMPYHNYTNIEHGENIHFQADTDTNSQLSINGSIDVTINGSVLPVKPFINVIFTQHGMFYKRKNDNPLIYVQKD